MSIVRMQGDLSVCTLPINLSAEPTPCHRPHHVRRGRKPQGRELLVVNTVVDAESLPVTLGNMFNHANGPAQYL